MPKVLFVNPPLGGSKRYGLLAQAGGKEYPFGLCYLAAVTRKYGFDTAILDADVLNLEHNQALGSILNYKPDYVGFTAATPAIKISSRLALDIKKTNPNVVVFLGGCHISSLPKQTLSENPGFDFGVIGEGENTVIEALQAMEKDNDLFNVKGLALRSDNKIILTKSRPRIKNLDDLPYPAFDLLPNLARFYRISTQSVCDMPCASLITSRGCLGKCSFCDKSVFSNQIAIHSAEYIVNLIEIMQKNYGIKSILFEDDNFMSFKPRIKKFVDLLKEKRIKISWSALSRTDTIDKETLDLAKRGGCWQIQYGIESGSQEILDFLQKGILINKVEEVLELTRKSGIETKGLFMIGNPLETEITVEETKKLAMNKFLSDITVTFFTPYPGSKINHNIDSYGIFQARQEEMTCYNVVFIPKGMTKDKLVSSQKDILKKFYLRPRIFISYLRRIKSFDALRELFTSAFTLFKYTILDGKNNHKR